MSTPWNPQLPVTRSLVEELLRQCPELDLGELVHVGAGWDHDVWRCGDLLVRFPHQRESLVAAARTAGILAHLADQIPIAIPVPIHIGEAQDGYPGVFVAYRWLPGELPAGLRLTEADRAAAAQPLAHALRALHAIPVAVAQGWGLQQAEIDGELKLRSENGRLRAQQLSDGPYADLARRAAEAMEIPPAECPLAERCVVHGDLHSGQVLLDTRHQLVAIIDWDEVAIGDPAYDLMMVYGFIPPAARAQFWEIYGAFEGQGRARHLALSYGLAILAQSIVADQKHLAGEAAFNLQNALAGDCSQAPGSSVGSAP